MDRKTNQVLVYYVLSDIASIPSLYAWQIQVNHQTMKC